MDGNVFVTSDELADWLREASMALYSDVDRELVRQSLADCLSRTGSGFDRLAFLRRAGSTHYGDAAWPE